MTQEEINKGLNEAYKEAKENAYFGNGFVAGVKFALNQVKNNDVSDNEAECKYKHSCGHDHCDIYVCHEYKPKGSEVTVCLDCGVKLSEEAIKQNWCQKCFGTINQ